MLCLLDRARAVFGHCKLLEGHDHDVSSAFVPTRESHRNLQGRAAEGCRLRDQGIPGHGKSDTRTESSQTGLAELGFDGAAAATPLVES